MSDDERLPAARLQPKAVIYKSTALLRTAPSLASNGVPSAASSTCIALAAATAEEVRARFKAQQDAAAVAPAPPTGGGDAADAARHKRRVALNRHSAASSRLRREAYVRALEKQLENLERSYQVLAGFVGKAGGGAVDAGFVVESIDVVAARAAGDLQRGSFSGSAGGSVGGEGETVKVEAVPEPVPEAPTIRVAPPPSPPATEEEPPPPAVVAAKVPPPQVAAAVTVVAEGAGGPRPAMPGVPELGIPPLPIVDGLGDMDPALVEEMLRLSGTDGLGGAGAAGVEVGGLGDGMDDGDLLAAYYAFDSFEEDEMGRLGL